MIHKERISFLKQKHTELDMIIQEEENHLVPNDQRLKELKLQKLHVKEELETLQNRNNFGK